MRIANINPEVLRPGWLVHGLPPRIQSKGGLSGIFFAKATYRMHHGGGCEPWEEPEQPSGDVPIKENPALGLGYPSDFVPYKPHGDFVVSGTAYPPSENVTEYLVGARVGDHVRKVMVHGKRRWGRSLVGEVPGRPETAGPVVLSYSNAWGGLDYPLNPIGMGREGEEMPLIEWSEKKVQSKSDRLAPAGFAPVPMDWGVRKAKLGTYTKEWIQTRWPWFPTDFDWTYFNAAPSGQWFRTYPKGDEELEFVNLHPSIASYRCKLPRMHARCFIQQLENGSQVFRQVAMVLDTIWVSPEEEKLILVWRGRAHVAHLKLKDVLAMMLLMESLDQPQKTLEEYEEIMRQKLARPEPPPQKKLPTSEEVHAAIAAKVAEREPLEKEIRDTLGKGQSDVENYVADQFAQQRAANLSKPGLEMPDPLGPGQDGIWEGNIGERVASKVDDAEVIKAATGTEKEFAEAFAKSQKFDAEFEARRQKAMSAFPPGFARTPPPKEEVRDTPELDEKGYSGFTLEKYDFSGQDLQGQNFSGAQLIECNFRAADLQNADLSQTTFVKCDLQGASLEGANLEKATLQECFLSHTCWRRARLSSVMIPEADLSGCDFSGATGNRAQLPKANLKGANFKGADLPFAVFLGSNLESADFSEANLTDADIGGANARGVILTKANLTRFRAGVGADLTGARIDLINGVRSVWKGSKFDGADFRDSVLVRAQMSDSSFIQTRFGFCDLREATFEDSNCEDANFTEANLLRVLFDRANLRRVHFDAANLYEASFWDADLHHAVWRRANIQRTILAAKN